MTTTEFAALVREKTKTNAATFSDTRLFLLANIFKNEIASLIVERNAGFFLIPATFDLVASSTSREYKFDDNMLNRMHKLELKFSANDARQPSTNIKDYEGSETESEIVKSFTNSQGGFAHTIRRRALLILSGTIVPVTGGGRLWYYQYPADLTAAGGTDMSIDPSTTTFGFPRQFHELLARRVSIEFKGSQPKPIALNRHELNYENDLRLQLDAISHGDESAEILGNALSDQDTGNNGFDY